MIYILGTLVTVIAYIFGRDLMIRQQPFGDVIISNLTLNVLLVAMFVGGYGWKITEKRPLWQRTCFVAGLMLGYLLILKIGGYELKFL